MDRAKKDTIRIRDEEREGMFGTVFSCVSVPAAPYLLQLLTPASPVPSLSARTCADVQCTSWSVLDTTSLLAVSTTPLCMT